LWCGKVDFLTHHCHGDVVDRHPSRGELLGHRGICGSGAHTVAADAGLDEPQGGAARDAYHAKLGDAIGKTG
jgi:hypothetical protein